MSTATVGPAREPSVVRRLNDHRKGSGWVLLGIGLTLLAIVVGVNAWYNVRSATESAPSPGPIGFTSPLHTTVAVWGFLCAAAFVVGGLYQLMSERPNADRVGGWVVVLCVVGGLGAATYFLGLALLYFNGDGITRLLSEGNREKAGAVFTAVGTLLAGLGIMFAAVLAVRSEERRSALLRRAVYGYNAFLTGFLLLAVLTVVNVVFYAKVPAAIDATRSGQFTLAEQTLKLLKEIDRPTKALVLLDPESSSGDYWAVEMRAFLSTAQERAPRLTSETINGDTKPEAIRALQKQFPQVPADYSGVLLIYGDEKQENATFIRGSDIFTENFSGGREPVRKFQGEVKFASELTFLMGGKEKSVIYFTQGAGEYDLNDATDRNGLGRLRERLQRRNFDVQALKWEPGNPKIPAEAKYLVIAGPVVDYPPAAVAALDRFLKGGGRLIALLDVPPTREKRMPSTGLEQLFAGFGVDVTGERLLALPNNIVRDTEVVLVTAAPEAADNPIAGIVGNPLPFLLCRLVRPMPQPGPQWRVTPLLSVSPQFGVWAEPDMQAVGEQAARTMLQSRDFSRLSEAPLPVAVTVTEVPPPAHPPTGERPTPKPKMIVVGDATFVTNRFLGAQQGASSMFDLFAGMVEWLRDKPQNIGVEPRTFQSFEMNPDVADRATWLLWLPLLAAIVTIAGLGASVWVARRR